MPSYSRRWGDLRSITQVAAAPPCRLTTVLAVDVGPAAKPSAACPAADDRSPLSADAHAPPLSLPASESPNTVRMQHETLIDVPYRSSRGRTAASISVCGIAALGRTSLEFQREDAYACRTASTKLRCATRLHRALWRAPQDSRLSSRSDWVAEGVPGFAINTSLRVWIRSVGEPRLFTSLPQGEAG